MASEVDICNLALSALRAGSINSLNDANPKAQYCKLHYSVCRDSMLENGTWGFANMITPLAVLDLEVFNWVYVYKYPTDCLQITRLIPDVELVGPASSVIGYSPTASRADIKFPTLPPIEYQVMNVESQRVIVCNEPNARIAYRAKVTDVNLFPVNFRMVLANFLAMHLAIPITGEQVGSGLKKEAERMYNYYLSSASANNTNERHKQPDESDFTNCYR